MTVVSNALTGTTLEIFQINYSAASIIPTVIEFKRISVANYMMFGSYLGGSGKRVGLIEFSDSQNPGTFACYTPP